MKKNLAILLCVMVTLVLAITAGCSGGFDGDSPDAADAARPIFGNPPDSLLDISASSH